ncbi:MAG: multidrug effflux MFS transporter [Alphaproteobacteria bacterium]|nr:multidrug effflux MFS transporter [Alphaproteobacteria bacterium]
MLRPDSLGLLLLLGLCAGLLPLGTDTYLPALPTIAAELAAPSVLVQATMGGFIAAFGLAQVFAGPLADRYGRRPLLIGGLLVFALASLGAAAAPDIEWLIAARIGQAFGACCGLVVGRAAIRDLFDRETGARKLARMSAVSVCVPLAMPPIGGLVLVLLGWRAIFVLLAAIGFALALWARQGFAETLPRRDPAALDFVRLRTAAGVILGTPSFLGHALGLACGYAGLFCFLSGSSFVLIGQLGIAPSQYGFAISSLALTHFVSTLTAARLVPRFGSPRLFAWGVAWMAAMGATMALGIGLFGPSLASVMPPMLAFMIGLAVAIPQGPALALAAIPPSIAGTASALIGLLQMTLAALASLVVALAGDGSAQPMALGIAASALVGLLAYRLVIGRHSP